MELPKTARKNPSLVVPVTFVSILFLPINELIINSR